MPILALQIGHINQNRTPPNPVLDVVSWIVKLLALSSEEIKTSFNPRFAFLKKGFIEIFWHSSTKKKIPKSFGLIVFITIGLYGIIGVYLLILGDKSCLCLNVKLNRR